MNIRDLTEDELLVFEILQKGDPATKKELEARLGWTASTTNRAVQSLLRKGAVEETGLLESTGGRRPSLFDIRSDSGCLLGIHISYGFVNLALCDLKLRLLDRNTLLLPPARETPEIVLTAAAESAGEMLRRQGRKPEEVLGAGLGIFGPLDRERGVLGDPMDFDRPIVNWSGLPIRDLLQEKLGIPVWPDFACNTAALAEYFYGAHKGSRNTAFFLCDIGISLGQITGGRLLRRRDDRDDSFSHVSIDRNGVPCRCGKRGCLHQYASVRAVIQRVREELRRGAPTLITAEHLDFGVIRDAAAQGDETVLAVLREAGESFGCALSNYLNAMNPDHVIVGGSLTEAGPAFYDGVIAALVRYHGPSVTRDICFRQGGSFGRMTAAIGAAALSYETLMGNAVLA